MSLHARNSDRTVFAITLTDGEPANSLCPTRATLRNDESTIFNEPADRAGAHQDRHHDSICGTVREA